MVEEDSIEDVEMIPDPEYLIKSISEQGYSIETAIADLIDNSISAQADKIEVFIDYETSPFRLLIVDNGNGMNEKQLHSSMKFPSASVDEKRDFKDLGRFGLGLKTASFSQTRKFTIVSRFNEADSFKARSWDVNHLKDSKKWNIIIPSQDKILNILNYHEDLRNSYLGKNDDFNTSTIVFWEGLYKFEDYIDTSKQKDAIRNEIATSIYNHLSIVFHRFLEAKKNPITIKINNKFLTPFNPFLTDQADLQSIEYMEKKIGDGSIKVEGFVLPSRSIKEVNEQRGNWNQAGKSLMDMEGIYIYRSNRIIYYGGWNEIVKKGPRLQLARLRVEVENNMDHLLHLNVAKSKIKIPADLTNAFVKYIEDLKRIAEKEFYNRENRSVTLTEKGRLIGLFNKVASNQGMLLELNKDFPLIASVIENLDNKNIMTLKIVFKMINVQINKIKKTYNEVDFRNSINDDGVSEDEILIAVKKLINSNVDKESIKNEVLPALGFKYNSLPESIKKILNEV